MNRGFSKNKLALGIAAALGSATIVAAPRIANADHLGTYVSGDFHNHETCEDGTVSVQKLVNKATETPWGLDWFVQSGHGGNGNRNCTLAEDASLATPAYPLELASDGVTVLGPNTTWQNSNPPIQPKGDVSGAPPNQNMWKWQITQEFMYPQIEYLSALKGEPMFMGEETNAPGHEHTSMTVITGQMPSSLDHAKLPKTPGYAPLGNATALSQWEYCFDRSDTDHSRGASNNWECSVPHSANASDPSWNSTAMKLMPASGIGTGNLGHAKTLEGLKWMNAFHPDASYYVPAHLERAGPFWADGNQGFNIESLRDFNNVAPKIAFGFESQPGHGASDNRGEYRPNRNNFTPPGSPAGTPKVLVDSVGGTTWGGTGVYAGQVGGVWDALLGEGRNWWFFASSDWHTRGSFGSEDRRSTADFYPGEYQRTYTLVNRGHDSKYRPQMIVDGLRTGNSWSTSGELIDGLAFIACSVPGGQAKHASLIADAIADALVETLTVVAAFGDTDGGNIAGCATMGQKLTVKAGSDIVVAIVAHDPSGASFSPYTFNNPSLLQIGIQQPLNKPVLDHIDVIDGKVTGYKDPSDAPNYAGEWPRTWLANPDLSTVPPAAKNTSATVIRTFNTHSWDPVPGAKDFKAMTFRLRNVSDSQYVRLRGTNLPPATPWETDANGNPLSDVYTNANTTAEADGVVRQLKIPCTTVGTHVPNNGDLYTGAQIDGCPNHLPTGASGQKMVAYDVAAWSDIWFYSNPIFVEVKGSSPVAGVQ